MKKKLMILGSLGEFTEMVKMAKSRSIFTIVCDQYPDGEAKKYADKSYNIPVTHIDEIAKICIEEQVDGIITAFSDLLFECMVKIADKAKIPTYLTPDKLDYYRNKECMKEMLSSLGIASPKGVCIDASFSASDLESLHFPVVVKPLSLYGSRGVRVCFNEEEVRTEFAASSDDFSIDRMLVEEYSQGYEFNMQNWIHNGKLYVLGIADREKTSIGRQDIPISTRNVYPSCVISEVYEEAKSLLEKVIAFTGQTEGALSMQFFWTPGKPIEVCEIAGRFLGYEHELMEYTSQVSIEKLLLDSVYDIDALEKTLENCSAFGSRCSAVLYFQGRNLKIANQNRAREIANWDKVVLSNLFYNDGDVVNGSKPYVARFYIICDTREELDLLSQKILDYMSIQDTLGNEILYANKLEERKA